MQVGHMIQSEPESGKRDEYLKRLMDLPNQVFILCLACNLISSNCSIKIIILS